MKKGIEGIQIALIGVVIVVLQSCSDSGQMSPQIQNDAHWDIDIRGTIYQQALSDSNSGWTFAGYPLW